MEAVFNLDELPATAKKFLPFIEQNRVIAFHGEMGSGKTTFIHALCEALGVQSAISSPTYSIINQYQGSGGRIIYHLDLYRLKDEEEALNAGVEDCLYSGQLCFVEWPEKAPGIFPPETLHISITTAGDDRKIEW